MISRLPAAAVLLALALTTVRFAAADTLELHDNRLFVPVTINGFKAQALLDSAAEITFVDPKLAAELKLQAQGEQTAKGSGGPTQIQFANGVSIEAAGVKLTGLTVALLDMTELSEHVVHTQLRIILGREFFDAGRVRIDITGGTIQKVDASVEPAGVKLPLTSHRGIESAPCKVEGIDTLADIDLGNGSEVLVGRAFAEKHGLLRPERIVERKQGGGIGGMVMRDIVVLDSLEIGGVKFDKVRGAIDPQPTAGEINIGTSILRSFVLVIDYPGRAVWFEKR